ncbi:MAG: hypothetical protein Q9M36_00420 [Sulfurovum sp.]|nr:hypothetical protein [Sulfurovum sp.]
MKSLLTFIQIHRSIKQHATRYSLVVVVLLFGLFLEAYMHDFNLVYITLFFVFSLAFSAGPLGILNLGHLKATFETHKRFFAKEEGTMTLKVENPSASTVWAITLYGQETSTPLAQLLSKQHTLLHLDYLPQKRGTASYAECYLESRYPLNTARLTLAIKATHTHVIYPQPKGKSLESFLNEEETYYGEEKEFDGLRAYDGSQKLSHIHWPFCCQRRVIGQNLYQRNPYAQSSL